MSRTDQDACQELKAQKERIDSERDEFSDWFNKELLPKAMAEGWFGVREYKAQAHWCWQAWKRARGL